MRVVVLYSQPETGKITQIYNEGQEIQPFDPSLSVTRLSGGSEMGNERRIILLE